MTFILVAVVLPFFIGFVAGCKQKMHEAKAKRLRAKEKALKAKIAASKRKNRGPVGQVQRRRAK